jgi:hypothetical protein
MNEFDEINNVLNEVGQRNGIEGLQLGPAGTCGLHLTDGGTIYFEWAALAEKLFIYTPLSNLPDNEHQCLAVCEAVAVMNCLSVLDGTVAVHVPEYQVLYQVSMPTKNLDADHVARMLNQLLDDGPVLAERVKGAVPKLIPKIALATASSQQTENAPEKQPESWLTQLNAFPNKGVNFFHDACSEADIAKVEAVCGRSLPGEYRQFLAHTGRGSDLFFIGEEIFFPDLLAFGQRARRLLAKDSAPCSLPEDAFVFFIHQDMQFLYFRLGAGEDPAVYGYDQGARKLILRYESFSEFMRAFIKIHAESYATLAHIYAPMLSLVSEAISHPADKLPGMGTTD